MFQKRPFELPDSIDFYPLPPLVRPEKTLPQIVKDFSYRPAIK